MGIERMTYWDDRECLLFGDRADIVADAPGVNSRIVDQRIYDFLFFHMIPAPHSVFDGVRKLEPGTYVLFENGSCSVNTYWRPSFRTDAAATERDLAAELLECLQAGVRTCGADDGTGAFLSGGLDSSTVAGMMRHVLGRPAPTFSIGFGVVGYDELNYARIANSHFGCIGHEYVVAPDDVLSALPVIAAAYDEPFGNSSAVPVLHCARLAKQHGMHHLLAGDGGDELFAGNDRYAKQKVFELYGSVPTALREQVFSRLVSFIDPNTRIAPLRNLRSYVEQASIPLPERLETWNYAYREGIGQMLSPAFAASIDVEAPMRHMREVFNRPEAEDVLDRELAYDWHFTLADSDLPKVSTMCELAGIAVSYPMLDHRLVDLCLKIPANMKLRGLSLRSFYRRAMRDFLPKAILDKKKHGFGLPFGIWLKANPTLAEMIYSNLSDLKNRQIFQSGFIDELIDQQRAGHHAYYGFFLWDLAILEQWLKRHSV
jgi:asparagine synthase (glutamine-hydrolysing)